MSEIRNLTRNGETFYPLTTSSAVINESTGEGLVIDEEPTAGSENLVKSRGIFGSKSVINLSKVLNAYVDASLTNDQYGYNIDTNNIVYKDDNGGLHSYSPKDGVLYLYNNLIFENGSDSLVLRLNTGAITVFGMNGVPSSPNEGVYYQPTTSSLIFASETSEQSMIVGLIRTSVVEGTEMLYNGNKYVVHNNVPLPSSKNVIITIDRLINFREDRKIVIPQGTVVVYGGDSNRYNVPEDVEVEIPTGYESYILKYNCNTNGFSVQHAGVKVDLCEYVICNFLYGGIKFKACSLPANTFGINSHTVSYESLNNKNKYPIAWIHGMYMQTGALGENATFNISSNANWNTRKLNVKRGDILYVRAVGGSVPKAVTITDINGEILYVNNGIASYLYIEQDGFVVVNSADSLEDKELTLYTEDANRDVINYIPLVMALNNGVSTFLSNNEFGYVTQTNLIVLKDMDGQIATFTPTSLEDSNFILEGGIFVAIENGIVLKKPQPPIMVKGTTGIGSASGFYYSPTVNQVVYKCETPSGIVQVGLIRSDAEGLLLTGGEGLVLEVKNSEVVVADGIPPMVHFTIDDKLKSFDGEATILPFVGATLFTEIYSKMDELVTLYPDFVEKVDVMTYLATEMAALGIEDYPIYANGIQEGGVTIQASEVYGDEFPTGHADYNIEYLETPAYKTYMYIFRSNLNNANRKGIWGNNQVNIHKKVLLIAGTHGYEMASQINCYNFAKQLCEDVASDRNYFALRNACDFYIIPCLNGYSLYHSPYTGPIPYIWPHHPRCNANGVNINRNYDCENGFVESEFNTYNYSGPFAFSEFESKIVKCLTEKIHPYVCIDHHSYAKSNQSGVDKYQVFFGDLPNAYVGRAAYQVAVDFSQAMQKHFPDYFGNSGNILLDGGATLVVKDVRDSQETSSWWSNIMNIPWSITCEISHDIMYDHGVPLTESTTWTATDEIFQINEYYLRLTLLRILEESFSGKYK